MALHPRVVHRRRATITALPLYYSGHLLKKQRKEKEFKMYYGELRGATLFLYEDDTQDTYTEMVDLEELKSVEIDSPYKKKTPTIFTLTLPREEVQLRMDNPDTGEEWRGYILTVIKKEIPSQLRLLPGQILHLEEVLAQEKRRNHPTPRPPLPPRPPFLSSSSSSLPPPPPPKNEPNSTPDLPACFFNVTRQEAERMLEANPEYGSMILRPSTLSNNYALTLRQLMSSGYVMKNYRVTTTNSGFVIELEKAVSVSSLNNVLKYFIEKTESRLHPYVPSQPYDTHITVPPPPKCISIISPAQKTTSLPRAQVAPMQRSETQTTAADSEYVVPDADDDHTVKRADLDGELRKVLKLRREFIYAAADEERSSTYENDSNKSNFITAQWDTESIDI